MRLESKLSVIGMGVMIVELREYDFILTLESLVYIALNNFGVRIT